MADKHSPEKSGMESEEPLPQIGELNTGFHIVGYCHQIEMIYDRLAEHEPAKGCMTEAEREALADARQCLETAGTSLLRLMKHCCNPA